MRPQSELEWLAFTTSLLSGIATVMTEYPIMGFIVMGMVGSVAAHLLDIEDGAQTIKEFSSYWRRMLVSVCYAIIIWQIFKAMDWHMGVGLLLNGASTFATKGFYRWVKESLFLSLARLTDKAGAIWAAIKK